MRDPPIWHPTASGAHTPIPDLFGGCRVDLETSLLKTLRASGSRGTYPIEILIGSLTYRVQSHVLLFPLYELASQSRGRRLFSWLALDATN